MSAKPVRIILGVPGRWEDRPVVDVGGDYQVEDYPPDPKLRRAFEVAGEGRFDEATLAAIAAHRRTLYLLGPGGSVPLAWRAMAEAAKLLDAGGLAVKIESTGKAHNAAAWREAAASGDLFRLYSTFVVLVGGREWNYSCGMHNLGLPDATVPASLGLADGARTLNEFHWYQLSASPNLASGHTIQVQADGPTFRLELRPCTQFKAENPFHNPFGVWQLELVEGR